MLLIYPMSGILCLSNIDTSTSVQQKYTCFHRPQRKRRWIFILFADNKCYINGNTFFAINWLFDRCSQTLFAHAHKDNLMPCSAHNIDSKCCQCNIKWGQFVYCLHRGKTLNFSACIPLCMMNCNKVNSHFLSLSSFLQM